MKRIWHPWMIWEEVPAGMWRKVAANEYDEYLMRAIEFTGDAEKYGIWMLRVLTEWPISSEHNLTDIGMDRDELLRLKQITGLAALFKDKEFSLAEVA